MSTKTIEQKAKAYDEALNWMREIYPGLHGATKEDAEHFFPELAYSEDERIRKAIIELLKEVGRDDTGISENAKCMIAYLEKQKDKEKYDRMQPVYDNLDSFESALAKAWKAYNDSGARTVDGCEDDYIECAHAKGFREGYLFGLEKQKENIEKEYVFRPLAGTGITIAAEQAIKRANEGDRLVLAFNGVYIPVRKGVDANKIVGIYDAFVEKQKEQKPSANEKSEKPINPSSKFHPGDWVVYDGPLGHAILQVKDVVDGRYTFIDNDSTLLAEDSDGFLRLLTPRDIDHLEKQKESLYISETCKENAESFTDGIIEVRSFQRGLEEGRRQERGKQKEQKPAESRKRNKPKESWLSKAKYEIEHADELLTQRQEELREIREMKKQEQKPLTTEETELNSIAFLEQMGYTCIPPGKDQKPVEWGEEDKAIVGCIACCLDGQFVTEAARKQCLEWFNKHRRDFLNAHHTEWSEEDEVNKTCIGGLLEDQIRDADGVYYAKRLRTAQNWLKSLPKRFNLQPKEEWSEEDEATIGTLINYFEGDALDCSTDEMIRRIRALRPSWKPSEEQMGALSEAVSTFDGYEESDAIKSLYNDLKKLK